MQILLSEHDVDKLRARRSSSSSSSESSSLVSAQHAYGASARLYVCVRVCVVYHSVCALSGRLRPTRLVVCEWSRKSSVHMLVACYFPSSHAVS